MEYILTGNFITAQDADRFGLVSRVVPSDKLVEEAIKLGEKIASFSKPVIALAKETINAADNLSLIDGLRFEKKTFYSTFGTVDRREGMTAFVSKRDPQWQDK
jgi:enoyl-CoA hydratase/carnithine racemase